MKLVELATKLELNQSEIVTFLQGSEAQVQEHSDMDLTDEDVAKVKSHFLLARRQRLRPKMKTGVSGNPDEQPSSHAHHDATEPVTQPMQEPAKHSATPEVPQADAQPSEEKIVRIETPKVELPGLKVIGKIDLPQPKEKSKKTDQTDTVKKEALPGKKKKANESDRKAKKRKTYKSSDVSSPRPLHQKELQHTKVKKEKEQRARHYYKKISQYDAPVAPLRKEKSSDYEVYQEEKPAEKSFLNKLFGWLAGS